MSIWNSLPGVPDEIPDRDDYDGRIVDTGFVFSLDVATATSWHDLVRVSLTADHPAASHDLDALLTMDETRALAAALQAAVERIEAAR